VAAGNDQNSRNHRDPAFDSVAADFRTIGSAAHPLIPRHRSRKPLAPAASFQQYTEVQRPPQTNANGARN
jgi:hypothetical protein